MVDVFISYKREERSHCERIARKLAALGLDVWFDAKLESGVSFDREIEQNIHAAKAVMVLWSPAAADSEWVRNEATIGKQRDVLVAAQIAVCQLPINFTNTHCEQLLTKDFADDDPAWLKLLERIGKLTERIELVSYSQALADAQGSLTAWAVSHPKSPLAAKIRSIASQIAVVDQLAEQRSLASPRWADGRMIAAAAGIGAVIGMLATVITSPTYRAPLATTAARPTEQSAPAAGKSQTAAPSNEVALIPPGAVPRLYEVSLKAGAKLQLSHYVTRAEWAVCMSAGKCPALGDTSDQPDSPVTFVSWEASNDYISWLSSGDRTFRMLTAGEWDAIAENNTDLHLFTPEFLEWTQTCHSAASPCPERVVRGRDGAGGVQADWFSSTAKGKLLGFRIVAVEQDGR